MTTARRRALGIVPARGGSKGIPRKNLRPLGGRPLIAHTFEAARGSLLLDRVILSTDDDEIAAVGRAYGIDVPFRRPAELASDTAPMLGVIQHAVGVLEAAGDRFDDIVLLQPTAPLRTAGDVDGAVALLWSTGAESVVSVCEIPHQFNPFFTFRLEGARLVWVLAEAARYTRRQDLPRVFTRNGAVYAFRRDLVMEQGTIYGDDCRPYEMPRDRSINLDQMFDFEVAEMVLASRGGVVVGA